MNILYILVHIFYLIQRRLICIAPWLINTCVSMVLEVAIFVCLELKIDEVDASIDRRIARSVLFGVFIGK